MDDEHFSVDELVTELSRRANLAPDQVRRLLQVQADLASDSLRRGFPVPGIGVLHSRDTPERRMVMRFGPDAGQEKVVPAKKILKFRVSKIMKDVFFGNPKIMPDVFGLQWYPADEPIED